MTRKSDLGKMMDLLGELLKDSNKSDRELAKVLGVSQPTISRMRKKLFEKKMIDSYSVIPIFSNMGYRIMVFTFVKTSNVFANKENRRKWFNRVKEWMMKKGNIIFADNCRGMGVDGGMISLHKSYNDFDVFITKHNQEFGAIISDVKNVFFNLANERKIKPLHFKYLADCL